MYFKKQTRAMYYDCDSNNRLKLSGAMRYMQQTSSEHLESIDLSTEKLYGENMVFLLTKSCMKIHDMPICSQELEVGTAAVETKGVRFVREFVVDEPGGKRLLSACTLWVLADTKNHKILRPKAFPYPLPLRDSIIDGAIGDEPIPKTDEPAGLSRYTQEIRYSHLDVNDHVNNCIYGDFICDAIPHEELCARRLDTVVLSFQHEAKWGDILRITTETLPDYRYKVSGSHERGTCFEAFITLK